MNIGAFGENFPYTNFHDLNLDWIVKTLKEALEKIDTLTLGKITIADPMAWDSTNSYPAFTIVENEEYIYISKQPVPAGVDITNRDYWLPFFDLNQVFTSLKEAISFSDDEQSSVTSVTRYPNQLVWRNEELYKITAQINQGEPYTTSNCQRVSIEEWVRSYIQNLANSITTISNEITQLNTDISNINSSIDELNRIISPARKILIVGDSYGMRNTPNYLSILISEMPQNVKGLAQSGYGFTNGDFYAEFDALIASLPATFPTDEVTDIIFAGGWNDARELMAGRQNTATLINRIRQTLVHAHEVCPNARTYTCFMAWHSFNSVQNQVNLESLLSAKDCYERVLLPYNGCLDDVQYIMRNTFMLDDSLFHPSTGAGYLLAYALMINLAGGAYDFTIANTYVTAYLENTGIVNTAYFYLYVSQQKGITKIKSAPLPISGTMVNNLLCKFKGQYCPVVMPDDTRPLYLNAYFKGTADNVEYNYSYSTLILYANGDLKLFVNGEALQNVSGNLIIDATVDNTQIR